MTTVLTTRSKTRFVDTSNPNLGIECPNCGLQTARFSQYCRNCGYSLWPSTAAASQAFRIWRAADPTRAAARPFDLGPPITADPPVVDYQARAHELGIHLFPSSRYPILICIGFLFGAFALVPVPGPVRLVAGIVGLAVFVAGVGGWWLVEDVRMYEETEHASTGEGH